MKSMKLHKLYGSELKWLEGAQLLNPSSFPWEEYDADNSWILDNQPPQEWCLLGWTPADKLRVRPKSEDYIALKFTDGERDFWQHYLLPKHMRA